MKKRKSLLIGITVIGVLICVMTMLVVFLFYQYTKSYEYHLKLAQKYLLEEEYEQAIAEYEIAISIDPLQKEAYEELAEIYVELEEYELAIEILEEGYQETEVKGLSKKVEKVKELFASVETEETDIVMKEEEGNAVAVESDAEMQATVEEVMTVEVEAEPEQEQENKNLYVRFLEGSEPLYFYSNQYEYEEEYLFETNRGYTLSEIVDVLRENYGHYEGTPAVKSVAYSYIDCGKDGIKEMAIQFNGMNIYSPDDDSTVVYIIKNRKERLELCYVYETWARSYSSINEYGFYESAGSNGASNHGQSTGYIDATGTWNFIQYTEEEMDVNQLSWSDMFGAIPQVASTKTYEGMIVFYTTHFEEMTADNYNSLQRYATFDVIDASVNQAELYTSSVYKEIFDEAGVKIAECIYNRALKKLRKFFLAHPEFVNYFPGLKK